MPSPTDISNLKYWLDASSGLFDATSGGNAVTADAANVASWAPVAGTVSGRSVQATVARRPVYDATKNLVVCDVSKVWNDNQLLGRVGFDLPASFTVDRQAFSAFAICEADNYGGFAHDMVHVTNGGDTVLLGDGATGKIGASGKLGGVASIPSVSRCLIGWVSGPSALQIWKNGTLASAAPLDPGSATLTAIMYDPNGVQWSGAWAVAAWVFYDKILSQAEVNATLLPWAISRGVKASHNQIVLCVGDSITIGYGPPCNRSWPSRLGISSYAEIKTYAQIATLAINLQANAAAAMIPLLRPNDLVVLWAGTNDVSVGNTGSATYAVLNSMTAAFHAVGSKVCLVTPLPHGASYDAQTTALRTLVLANSAGAEAVADPYANAAIAAHWGDGTYDWDTIHPNAAGNALCASIITTAISSLVTGGSGSASGSPSSRRFFGFRGAA